MGTERNYARFYALLKQMPYADKETLVEQYTHGRTTHLHETTEQEYRMQQLGVNTTDWPTVDNFCLNPRVSGKRFAQLDAEALDTLQVKLRMIKKHGGLKTRAQAQPKTSQSMIYIPLGGDTAKA